MNASSLLKDFILYCVLHPQLASIIGIVSQKSVAFQKEIFQHGVTWMKKITV